MKNFDLKKYLAEGRLLNEVEDLELKSLAKKLIPVIKKYKMPVEYITSDVEFNAKPKEGGNTVPAKLLIKDGILTVAVYFLSLADSLNELDAGSGPSEEQYKNAKTQAAKMYKDIVAVIGDEFELKANKEDNKYGYYLMQVRKKGQTNEGKLNEENYEPGRGWTNNFDYDGMLNLASMFDINTPMDILLKVSSDMEDVNYHRENSYLTDAIDAIKDGNKQEAFIAFRMLKKEIAKLQESEIKERKPIVKNTKMKKSELKEIIKSAMMAEGPIKEELLNFEGDDMYPEIKGDMKRYYKMDVPMDVIKDWADDYFPNRYDDKDDYEFETSSREDFLDHLEDEFASGDSKPEWWNLTEAEEVDVEDNEEVDVDIEKDVEIDDESVESDIEVKGSMPGEDADEVAVQSLLMKAQEEAAKLGDEKLTDQIGNTITYFTRAHVAQVDEDVNEETDYDNSDAVSGDINVTNDNPAADAEIGLALNEEVARFKKLAGIIK